MNTRLITVLHIVELLKEVPCVNVIVSDANGIKDTKELILEALEAAEIGILWTTPVQIACTWGIITLWVHQADGTVVVKI